MAIRVREGRWALSRIVTEASEFPGGDVGFTTAAMRDRLAQRIDAHYPPMMEALDGYALPFALVRMQGNVQPGNADTRLIPAVLVDATLRDLTAQQRQRLASELAEWMPAYEFVDFDGARRVKQAFSAAGYTLDTPLRRILLDLFQHLGHSETRLRASLPESHNTEYLDDFSTDPASRWTVEDGGYTWDSGNGEMDITYDGGPLLLRYSANGPGSIEHECQVTANDSKNRLAGPCCRFDDAGVNDAYTLDYNRTGNVLAINRYLAGSATQLATLSVTNVNPAFWTLRLAAEGGAGANVALEAWYTNHGTGAGKPADPGWHGDDGSPDLTYTDTDASRLDATSHSQCGIGGPSASSDGDLRHDFWKSRAISDRSGGGTTYNEAVSESASATDSVSGAGVLVGAISEAATAADIVASQLEAVGAISEAGSAADSVASLLSAAGEISEAASALDSVASLAVLVAALAETATATDTVNAGAAVYDMDVIETASALDSISAQLAGVAAVSEAGVASDSVSALAVLLAAIAEAGTALDTLTSAGVLGVSIIEVGTATDSVSAGGILLAAGERIIEVRFADRTVRVDQTGRLISVSLAARTIN
ncbi:MAG: hypothetical protein AB7O95_20900 [Geminicoccaceae bacterium]